MLHLTSIKMCGIDFNIFDLRDCKISTFKVKKTIFFLHIAGLN